MLPVSCKVIRAFKTMQENIELGKFMVRQTEYFKLVGLSKINQVGMSKLFINLYNGIRCLLTRRLNKKTWYSSKRLQPKPITCTYMCVWLKKFFLLLHLVFAFFFICYKLGVMIFQLVILISIII